MKKLALALALVAALASPALAQFPSDKGAVSGSGSVAIGQVQAQVDPNSGKVAIIQAPPIEQKSGGIIHLSAFGWLAPYVDTLLQGLIALGFAIIGKSKYSQWLDQSSRDALETFLKNRASSLIADGAVRIQGKAVHVDSNLLFRAATEASTAIPDALKRFKLTPDVVAQKIIDAIPQVPAGSAIVAASHQDSSVVETITDRPPAAPILRNPPMGPVS